MFTILLEVQYIVDSGYMKTWGASIKYSCIYRKLISCIVDNKNSTRGYYLLHSILLFLLDFPSLYYLIEHGLLVIVMPYFS